MATQVKKMQDGGWKTGAKSVKNIKNSEWQKAKPKPFVHGKQESTPTAKMQVGGSYKKGLDQVAAKYKPLPNHTGKPAKPKPLPNNTGKKITTKDIYQGKNGAKLMKKGGSTDKNWIQKAVNPAHKGYCTPMSKPTCTPKRKALARTFKAMAKNK